MYIHTPYVHNLIRLQKYTSLKRLTLSIQYQKLVDTLHSKGYTASYTVLEFCTRLLQENISISTQAIHITICCESL